MKKVDQLIEKISALILKNIESGYNEITIDMIKALAELVSARASFEF